MPSNTTFLKLLTIVGVTVVVFLLDWFYLIYFTAYGLQQRSQQVAIANQSMAIPLQWLPILGIVFVSLVAWYEVTTQLFPRRGVEIDPMAKVRLLRAVVLSVAVFVCVLYIPYLIGSNWLWARLGEASKSITQLRDLGFSLLNATQSVMVLNTLWLYSLSQVLAAGAMVLTALIFGRVARRPRKQR